MGVGEKTVTPRVSVIVPVRDRRMLLRACLDALARQTLLDHEVVVVDDGSTDGAGKEALDDQERGRPVRLVSNSGRGAVAARRAGVDAALAPLLAFTDSDCVPEPDWLATGVAALDGGADLAVGRTAPARDPRPFERTVAVDRDDGLCPTSNAFYRRSAYEAAGGFDPAAGRLLGFRPGTRLADLGFGEDTLLAWRVRRGGRFAFVPDAVVVHEVFRRDLGESVRRAWTTGAFPALVGEVPELRRTLLVDGVFLGDRRRLPAYVAAAALVGGRRRLAAAAVAVWAVRSWRQSGRAAPAALVLDAVAAAALVAGSARSRTVVL